MTLPLVSILMVARNAAAFIDAAIASARDQSLADLEIIVVDDGSSDDTAAIARDHAAQDVRVRLVEGPRRGLSAVRNASLDAARGRFAAILDSDDVLHPRHLEWLVAARAGAQICVTNMIEFETSSLSPRLFAQGEPWSRARTIGAGEFVEHGMIGGGKVSLGYFKPLFDMDFLNAHGLRYDERLRIGEDFDLVLRALLAGAEYRFLPQATYYYRKHAASTSHRLARDDLEGLLHATHTYPAAGDDARWLQARRENLEGALLHLDAVAAIKAGRPLRALALAAGHADARRLTVATLGEALAKRAGRLLSKSEVSASSATGAEPVVDRLRTMTEGLHPAVSPK
jgi:succinoglycan biosynthesis protein ExoO